MVFVAPCSLFVYCRVFLLAGVVLLLFRVSYVLLVVRSWLLCVVCLLAGFVCWLLFHVCCCLMVFVRCSLFVDCLCCVVSRWLFVVCCS